MTSEKLVKEILHLLPHDYPVEFKDLRRSLKVRVQADGAQVVLALKLAEAKRLVSVCGTVVTKI